jgi:hypothetical protein
MTEFIDESKTQPQQAEVDSIWLTKTSVKPFWLAISFMLALCGLFAFRPLMYGAIIAILWISIAWISEGRDESDELPLT